MSQAASYQKERYLEKKKRQKEQDLEKEKKRQIEQDQEKKKRQMEQSKGEKEKGTGEKEKSQGQKDKEDHLLQSLKKCEECGATHFCVTAEERKKVHVQYK